jgi:hypothetical protein
MAVFRDVRFWPSTGFPDGPWLLDPSYDAFVKSARRVCELYSEGLGPARLHGPSARLQLMTADEHQDEGAVKVEVETEFLDVGEIARVSIPDGIDRLTAEQRGLLVLDVVHGAVVRLAEARGWDVTAAAAARDHALNQQLVFTWAGPGRRAATVSTRHVHCSESKTTGTGACASRSASATHMSPSPGRLKLSRSARWRASSAPPQRFVGKHPAASGSCRITA